MLKTLCNLNFANFFSKIYKYIIYSHVYVQIEKGVVIISLWSLFL